MKKQWYKLFHLIKVTISLNYLLLQHVKDKNTPSQGPSEQTCILQIFTFMHLEDSFIQSILQ